MLSNCCSTLINSTLLINCWSTSYFGRQLLGNSWVTMLISDQQVDQQLINMLNFWRMKLINCWLTTAVQDVKNQQQLINCYSTSYFWSNKVDQLLINFWSDEALSGPYWTLSLKGPHPVEVDQLLINMLLVWNSIFLAKVDQHVDHLINFVDQLLINMLISWSTLLFNSWSTCCFHVTCCSTVDQHVVLSDVQKLINCWSTCWNMSHHDKLFHTFVDQLLINLLFVPQNRQHVDQQLHNMLILSLINMLINSWSSMEPHGDQLR